MLFVEFEIQHWYCCYKDVRFQVDWMPIFLFCTDARNFK